MNSNKHLNSLGFVIGGKQGRPFIVWGLADDGSRVRIDKAERGGSQNLRCECGALLVAKKGDIRTHHFAHKAGDVRHCDTASLAAKANFIADAMLDNGHIDLPITAGRLGQAEVLAIANDIVEGCPVHFVDAQKGRKLLILVRLRRQGTALLQDWCRRHETSGVVIDLTAYRNSADDDIKTALTRHALRQWIYRSEAKDMTASRAFLRRLYGL
jgi:hypothetical protein